MGERGEIWTVLALLVALNVHLGRAEFCQSGTAAWQCACGCCDDYDYCCVSCASYWYAWLLMTLFFLICLCACLGCGSYGYRRYRRTSLPASYIVARGPGYGSAPTGYHGFKPSTARTTTYQPYQPPAAATATGYHNYSQTNAAAMGYHDYQPSQVPTSSYEVPPPYNPNKAPPPYSAH